MFWLVGVHHLTCYYRFCVQDGGTLLTYTIKSSEQYRVKSSDIIILTLVMYAFSRTFRRSLWAVASKLEGKRFWNPVIATMYSLKPGCYYWLVCDTWYSYLTVIRCYCYKMLRIIFRELYMNIFTGIVQEIIKANTKTPNEQHQKLKWKYMTQTKISKHLNEQTRVQNEPIQNYWNASD